MVSLDVCAGARVFFDETFDGNGRTCGTCHPASNNFTVEPPFIETLPDGDPLFVAEDPAFDLVGLETSALRPIGLIKENVDGFEDNDNKFVSRSVPHTLSLATSLEPAPFDGTSAAVIERTGWSGDGAPADGSLRQFINGAIVQHYPVTLDRIEGADFRLATSAELDQVLDFQMTLGRLNDIDLEAVTLTDTIAEDGRGMFIDPQVGRCNACHGNAGANTLGTEFNANFNTSVEQFVTGGITIPVFNGVPIFDGGFGGQGLAAPNFPSVIGIPDSFGDGTFNTPPVIEAADTGPFFHNNSFGNPNDPFNGLEGVVGFYGLPQFNASPAGEALIDLFGTPISLDGDEIGAIARFLRVLNVAFNLDIAIQRLDAARTLNTAFWNYREDIQIGLTDLASAEVEDARHVLEANPTPLHPTQQTTLSQVETLLDQAATATDPSVRLARIQSSLNLLNSARSALGTGIDFDMGEGNLMF